MAKAAVLALVNDLSYAQADATTVDRYYAEVVQDLTRRGAVVTITLVDVVAGTATYSPPDEAIDVLGVYYDDRVLSRATPRELEWSYGRHWRDVRGSPVAYVEVDETEQAFRLVPVPDHASKPASFIGGSPFGVDYPEGTLALIVTERREDLPEWFDLPLALLVCAREFARESNHRDGGFAQACGSLADAMLAMLAV